MITLHTIFGYLRDLYSTGEPLLRFDNEPQNYKQVDVQYFTWQRIQLLADLARRGKYGELTLDWSGLPELPFLTIKRVAIPALKTPDTLAEWVVLPKHPTEKPTVLVKTAQKLHRFSSFDRKKERLTAFEALEAECLSNPSPTPPILPAALDGWVTWLKNEAQHSMPHRVAYKDETELFEDSEQRSIEYAQFSTEFARYYDTYWTAICINQLYDALHTLHYDLRGKENKRVYLSFGLLNGKIGGQNYLNFLFHIPLKLTLKNQQLSLELDTFANKIVAEQQFTELLTFHFAHEAPEIVEQRKLQVMEAIDAFNRQINDFYWDGEYLRTHYYEAAQRILSVFADLQVDFCENNLVDTLFYGQKENQNLTLTFSPIIQTKIVESELLIAKDASNILKKIDELERNNELHLVPQFFKKLVPTETGIVEAATDPTAEPLLFPLPYNTEQHAIAERLTQQDAVTVKGPPGTGKSHTIANLVSNYVAHGKSVLIVSQNAQALSVVKEKLPSELQELAISLVNDARPDALKSSVSSIIAHLSRVYSSEDVAQRSEQLAAAEAKYTYLLQEIYAAIGVNSRTIRLKQAVQGETKTLTAHDCAVLLTELRNRPAAFRLDDAIANGTDTSDFAESLLHVIRSTDFFNTTDIELANFEFAKDDAFMDEAMLKEKVAELKEMQQNHDFSAYGKVDPTQLSTSFIELIDRCEIALMELRQSEIGFAIWRSIRFNALTVQNILGQFKENRAKDTEFSTELLQYDIDFSPIAHFETSAALRHTEELLSLFGEEESLGFFAKFKVQPEQGFVMKCAVNSQAADVKSRLLVVRGVLLFGESLKKQQIVLNNHLAELGVGRIVPTTTVLRTVIAYREAHQYIEGYWNALEKAITTGLQFHTLNNLLLARKIPLVLASSLQFEKQWNYVTTLKHYGTYREGFAFLSHEKQRLLALPKAHPIMLNIADSLTNLDAETYAACLKTYRTIRTKAQHIQTYNEALNRLRKGLPKTTETLHQRILKGDASLRMLTTDEIETAIVEVKLSHFIDECLREIGRTDDLLQQLNSLKRDVERYTGELVVYKTWFNKSKSITDNEKSALTAWLNDLTNIGKGYGKNTSRNRASAVQNMQLAKGAVPIWIMQLSNALTFFPEPTPGQFDVLIIDEASQCDMSSLNLIFRAKKSIIVGDENQTAVTIDYTKFNSEKVNALLDRYFLTHSFKQQFNIQNKNNSIYSLSSVIYPNIITLVEHFRCLPQIIGYSNQYVYSNRIVPLKTAISLPFGAPVAIEYVADEYAEESRQPIVDRILTHILSYISAFEENKLEKLPTVGVLTLDSSNQKHYRALMATLLANQSIAKYADALDLTIGTSREFQGDERNLMFLTISAMHTLNASGEIRPPRAVGSEEYMRIYNVAASRAKDRCVVLHSIVPEAVGLMSADCYRKRLISYYTLTQRSVQETRNHSLDSLLRETDGQLREFGREVCRFLVEKGLGEYLYPNFTIGAYKTDFAILQQHQKVAIFCDMGINPTEHDVAQRPIEQSIAHQLILERAGWYVIRLQSAQWFADTVRVKERLTHYLTQNV